MYMWESPELMVIIIDGSTKACRGAGNITAVTCTAQVAIIQKTRDEAAR